MVIIKNKPVISLLWLIASAIIFFLPHYSFIPVPFGYALIILPAIYFVLKQTGENFTSIFFSWKKITWKAVWVGALSAIVLFCFLQYAFFPLLNKVFQLKEANLDDFAFIRHNFAGYIFILVIAIVIGGFYEELVFHGFIFTRLEKLLNTKSATFISFLLTNIIFALYHFQLGASGMINALVAGMAYHFILLKFQRNLWYALFFHALFDFIGLTLIYLGYW